MNDSNPCAWRAPAAYLYAMTLDPVSLAWEYLRRNPSYRAAWAVYAREHSTTAAAEWGLKEWEDPRQDARSADPMWWPVPASSVALTPSSAAESATNFQLWRILGRKSLAYDGAGMHLTARHDPGITRAVLDPGLTGDQPYAYRIAAGGLIEHRCRAVNEFDVRYRMRSRACAGDPRRPNRSALTGMRTLQAIDGADAGATHRELAVAIFGDDAVERDWSTDGELRAQVRYLLKRGRTLAAGGYRDFLNPDSS